MFFCIAVVSLDQFLFLHIPPYYPTYTVREQETENDNINNSQVVVDKVGLVVQMVVDFFLSTV